MRLLRERNEAADHHAELARRRVAAIRQRSGWVPKVPSGVADQANQAAPAMERADHASETGRVAAGADAEQSDAEPAGGPRPGRAGGPRPGRHRSTVGAAVADRLPLPLRTIAESFPSGVRRGDLGLERGQAFVVLLVILLGLAVAALVAGVGRPRVAPVEPASTVVVSEGLPAPGAELPEGRNESHADHQTDGGPADLGELVIHVAGKVADPGVVRLPAGSRVVDAVEAAGGADAGVDLTPLNLARLLTDGEQVLVGVEPPPGAEPAPTDGEPAGGELVNLNTATSEQLQTLPGIGPALAAQIIQWREQHGRFTAIEELEEVSGIGTKKFAALADLVSVQ